MIRARWRRNAFRRNSASAGRVNSPPRFISNSCDDAPACRCTSVSREGVCEPTVWSWSRDRPRGRNRRERPTHQQPPPDWRRTKNSLHHAKKTPRPLDPLTHPSAHVVPPPPIPQAVRPPNSSTIDTMSRNRSFSRILFRCVSTCVPMSYLANYIYTVFSDCGRRREKFV